MVLSHALVHSRQNVRHNQLLVSRLLSEHTPQAPSLRFNLAFDPSLPPASIVTLLWSPLCISSYLSMSWWFFRSDEWRKNSEAAHCNSRVSKHWLSQYMYLSLVLTHNYLTLHDFNCPISSSHCPKKSARRRELYIIHFLCGGALSPTSRCPLDACQTPYHFSHRRSILCILWPTESDNVPKISRNTRMVILWRPFSFTYFANYGKLILYRVKWGLAGINLMVDFQYQAEK